MKQRAETACTYHIIHKRDTQRETVISKEHLLPQEPGSEEVQQAILQELPGHSTSKDIALETHNLNSQPYIQPIGVW